MTQANAALIDEGQVGTLCRRTGQRQQAQEHLTTATTMYREMGMTDWLEQAEAEMAERL